jgi:hypothetical protein
MTARRGARDLDPVRQDRDMENPDRKTGRKTPEPVAQT